MLFAALTARKMGGGRFAQALTAIAVMLAPMFMSFSGMFTYDVFDQLMSAIVVLHGCQNRKRRSRAPHMDPPWLHRRHWPHGKNNDGVPAGMPDRRHPFSRARANTSRTNGSGSPQAIAAACFVPFIIWQAVHGFPIVEYLQAYKDNRTFSPSATKQLQYVFVAMNPAAVLLWLGGLALLFTRRGRAFRPFAWAFLAYFTLATAFSVKFYALAGVLLPLVAFGSVCLEKNYRNAPLPLEKAPDSAPQLPGQNKGKLAWALKASYLVVICLLGVALVPLCIPMLSPAETALYNKAVGYSKYVTWDTVPSTGIPTFFAGRLGWSELAQSVSDVYFSLPEDEQKDCAIYCSLYGEVGAIDYYNEENGLPPAISADLGCYYWGYGSFDGKCMIFLNMGSNYLWELEIGL